MHKRRKATATLTQRALLAFCGVLVVLTTTGTVLLRPKPAQAFLGIGDITFEVNQMATFVWEKAQEGLRWAMDHGAALAFKNALRTFTQRIAYDTAVMLASGGQGQTPLLSWRSLGQSAQRAYDDAAGDFLDTLDTENGFVRLGLCQPVGFDFRLIVTSAMFNEIQPRRPRCTLTDIERNIERYRQDPSQFLNRVGVVFDPKQNQLGVAVHLQQTLIRDAAAQQQLAVLEQGFNQGFLDITEPITGFIKTPASRVRNQAETSQEIAAQDFSTYTGDILADALGVFTNTLAARLMKRLLQGDIPSPSRLESRQFGLLGQPEVTDYAVQVNSLIATPQLVGGQDMDVISEYSTCPQDVRYATVNNCTITERFANALRKADEGQPLSVQEAIDQGYINAQLRFALVRTTDDQRAPTKSWYLSDIKKLRKARIVPLGWELAAQAFANSSVTLQQVIGTKPNYDDGFNGKGADGACGTADDTSPYCGLIDPNWILKAPAQQCRSMAYGQLLESEGANRQQTCVDVQQCVAERSDGSCLAWGYCTQEKSIWRLSGQSCEFPQGSGYSPYATCQTYTNSSGKSASYLASSLANYDDGICSEAVGCKWYSAALNSASSSGSDRYLTLGDPNLVNTVNLSIGAATAPKLYLKEAERYRCTSKEEGCTEFLRLSQIDAAAVGASGASTQAQLVEATVNLVTAAASTDTYEQYAQAQSITLKEAPAYLNCYDADPANDALECRSYALMCSADEVGCELYTPTDGSPAVPGVANSSNLCPNECVGLNEYAQQSSFFEPNPNPATYRFIPASAAKCSAQYAGCEEFTNVEQNERKEYYTEMRQCVRPGEGDAVYYSWVGSDLTGYQLKAWRFQGGPSQPPTTTDGSGDCRAGGTFPTSDPDCKEFYDQSGNPHYRLFTKTRSASEQCNRYRRTGTVGTDFTASDCTSTGGTVEGSFCFYRGIPSQGKVCAAQAVGCREYRGPTASNIRLVFPVSTFGDREAGVNADTSPTSGWTGGTNSNESTSAFGHSLAVSGTAIKEIQSQVQNDRQYLLTFWAQGTSAGQQFTAAIEDRAADVSFGQTPASSVADTWQVYVLGPITLSGLDVATARLMIWASGGGFYLDNVQFREIQDSFFVRKNAWNTPATCDTNAHLRCTAYRTRSGQQVALTGFTRICRAEAAGCEALVNTQNSASPRTQTFDVGGQSVTVPNDRTAYRVYDSKKVCSAAYAGCRRVGAPTLGASGAVQSWSDTFIRLDPDTFDPVNPISPLCGVQQDRCEQFTDASGATHYFKDPRDRVCEYKLMDTQHGYDWYKKGTTERCNLVDNPSFESFTGTLGDGTEDVFPSWSGYYDGLLYADFSRNPMYWESAVLRLVSVNASPTGAAGSVNLAVLGAPNDRLLALYARAYVPSGATFTQDWNLGVDCAGCTVVGGNPTLPTSAARDQWHLLHQVVRVPASATSAFLTFTTGPSAGQEVLLDKAEAVALDPVLSNSEALSLASVPYAYLCPSDQAGCTAFRDPELTKETYYYVNNDRLDKETCSGRVSEKEGCLLFNELSSVSLTFNAPLTYADSRANNNRLVAPSNASPQDTNLVLRVQRDRTCGEWLACQSESPRFNPQTNRFDNICYSVNRCNSLAGTVAGSSARCGNWLTRSTAPEVQDITWYQQQPRDWDDPEYSGYSLPDIYPLDVLTQHDYSDDPQDPDYRLTYIDRAVSRDYGLNGTEPGAELENTGPRLCRIYPQADAPFPAETASTWKNPCQGSACPAPGDPAYIELPDRLESGFSQANTCQRDPTTGRLENCECSYQRVAYTGGEQLFHSITSSQVKSQFATDVDFNDNPLMSRVRRLELAFGQRGYCIEKDTSRVINAGAARDYACLTWYPTDVVAGEISVYDYAPEAGYQGGNSFYCSEAKGNRKLDPTGAYNVGAHNGAICTSGIVGGDNYYCNAPGYTITGQVNTCALFNVPAVPVNNAGIPDEQNIAQNDVQSIAVRMVGYYGSGLGGGQYINGTIYLDDSNDWCNGGTTGEQSVEAICNVLSGTSLQASAGQPACIGGPGDFSVIKAVFNPTTKQFVGYNVMVADGSADSGGAIMNTSIRLKEYCTETVQTATNVNNKAWTDRLLGRNDYNVPPITLNFWNNRPDTYYGKLPMNGAPTGEFMYISDSNQAFSWEGRSYLRISSPYACSGNCGPITSSTTGTCSNTAGRPCTSDAECVIIGGGTCAGTGNPCQNDSQCENTCIGEDPGNGIFGVCAAGGGLDGSGSCEINSDCFDPPNAVCSVTPTSSGSCIPPISSGGAGMCITGTPEKLYKNCNSSADCSGNNVTGICMGYFSGICQGGTRNGQSCLNHASCGGGSCESLVGMSANTGTAGRSSLDELFAQEYYRWRFTINNVWQQQVQVSDISGSTPGSLAPGVPAAPEIRRVIFDAGGHAIGEGSVGFTILANGTSYPDVGGNNITVNSGDGVSVVFYAYNPNGEQMPLNRVLVDWEGNSDSLSGAQGKFKNRKHDCRSQSDANYNWGDDPRACQEDNNVSGGYFTYTHIYTCPAGQTCTYTPRVYVQDNWEWCYGVSGAQWGDQCNITQSGAWLPFPGSITVNP